MTDEFKTFAKTLRDTGHVVVDESRKVPFRENLTEDERPKLSAELAQMIANKEAKQEDHQAVHSQLKAVQSQIKDAQSQLDAEIGQINRQISQTANILNMGYRVILKPVITIADFVRKQRVHIDPETAQEMGAEPLQDGDYQIKIEIDQPGNERER